MKIINTTGIARDTKVLDDEGNDITARLRVTKIVIAASEVNVAVLTCEGVELDIAAKPLTAIEKGVLEWLAKEETSALGECHGQALDRLVALGLATITPPASPDQDQFYSRVALTEAGHVAARAI